MPTIVGSAPDPDVGAGEAGESPSFRNCVQFETETGDLDLGLHDAFAFALNNTHTPNNNVAATAPRVQLALRTAPLFSLPLCVKPVTSLALLAARIFPPRS